MTINNTEPIVEKRQDAAKYHSQERGILVTLLDTAPRYIGRQRDGGNSYIYILVSCLDVPDREVWWTYVLAGGRCIVWETDNLIY